jgi:hypothetical protein
VFTHELNETYWSSEKMLPVSAYGVSEKYQKRFNITGGEKENSEMENLAFFENECAYTTKSNQYFKKKCNQQIEEKKLATKMKRLPFAKKLNWIRLREGVRSVQTLIVSNKNVLTIQNKN